LLAEIIGVRDGSESTPKVRRNLARSNAAGTEFNVV
jgi:hypothetical protein